MRTRDNQHFETPNINIPDNLLFRNISSEDVNIIIGENGSGKSLLLSQLADLYLKSNYSNVIVFANSIHDKFNKRSSIRFHSLKNSSGKKQTINIMKKSFVNMKNDSSKKIRFATRILDYVGFDARLGFDLEIVGRDTLNIINNIDDTFKHKIYDLKISDNNKELLYSTLSKFIYHSEEKRIIWFQTTNDIFSDNDNYQYLEFFKWEKLLISNNIIKPINVYLSKNRNPIPLLSASSGELSLITSILYISSIIDENTVIIIDEPENSLHPKWQREYVKNLVDIFYLYQPRIVIATHSPMIVTGSELSIPGTKVFKATEFEFDLQSNKTLNIEEVYYELFDTIMPENRILSNILVNQLNKLEKKEIKLEDFLVFLGPIYENVRDIRQTKMLHGVSELAKKIVLQRKD
jgi:predicted ATPase